MKNFIINNIINRIKSFNSIEFLTNKLQDPNTYIKLVLSAWLPLSFYFLGDFYQSNHQWLLISFITWSFVMVPFLIYIISRISIAKEIQVASLVIFLFGLKEVVEVLNSYSFDLLGLFSGLILMLVSAIAHDRYKAKASLGDRAITLGLGLTSLVVFNF